MHIPGKAGGVAGKHHFVFLTAQQPLRLREEWGDSFVLGTVQSRKMTLEDVISLDNRQE